jgi:ABC transport system ATP-binding/permease protein
MICVDAERIAVAVGDKELFDGLSVTVTRGDRVAVVGVNGSGKTTLLRVLTGAQPPDAGVVRFGRGVRIAVLEQEPQLRPGTVADVLGDSWEVAAIATSLGVRPLLDWRTDELSGGQAKRVALASALVGEYDMLVLDEPTNHLDLEAIEWLEERLAATSAAVVLVSHDRHLLDRVTSGRGPGTSGTGKVVELDRGRGFVHVAAAGSSAYAVSLDARAARLEQDAAQEATRRILARHELAWLRRGAPARSTKPKARLRHAAGIVGGGPGPSQLRDVGLRFGAGMTRLGNQVVELDGVGRSFGEHVVLRDVDLVVDPGGRLGVVGPNGSGKSTMLQLVAGVLEPDVGTVQRGTTVVTGFADQHAAALDPDAIVRELVAGPLRRPDHEDRALLERFWFDATAQYSPVRLLSGGERRRLQLVMVLATKPNLLVLDEPTNDLDLDTLRALEEFLDDWPGALLVASHDRAFLDRTVDHVLAIGPDRRVERVPGGVAGWLSRRAAERTAVTRGSARPASSASKATDGSRSEGSPRAASSASTVGRQLRRIEQDMVTAQRHRDRLVDELHAATDHAELARLGVDLAAAQAELDELEERWLEVADGA